jgi:ubiquinone/menaquinone biosynthesis C-methylase UbiE
MSKESPSIWSQAAPYWDKHRETIRTMFAPVSQALIDDAEIGRGYSVLDVATGPGEPALRIAEVVAPNGEVVGVDPAPEMVDAANRAAARYQLKNVRFEVSHANPLPFSANTFDAAVSRFGAMFFRSPAADIQEILRVLKPNAKLAFAVWYMPDRNPFHYVLADPLERYVPSEPPAADSPDAFRYAPRGTLLNVMNESGAALTSERLLQFKIEAPLTADEFWRMRTEMSDKLRSKLKVLSAEQLAAVHDEVIQSLGPYTTKQGVSFPAEVLIVSGRKQ